MQEAAAGELMSSRFMLPSLTKLTDKQREVATLWEGCDDYSLHEKLTVMKKECDGLRERQRILVEQVDKHRRWAEALANELEEQRRDADKKSMSSREFVNLIIEQFIEQVDGHMFMKQFLRQELANLDSFLQDFADAVFEDVAKSVWFKLMEFQLGEYQNKIGKLQTDAHSLGGWYSDEGENNSDKDAAERDDTQEACTSACPKHDPAFIEDDLYALGKGARAKSSFKRPEAKTKSSKQHVSKFDNSLLTVIQQQEEILSILLFSLKTLRISTAKSEEMMKGKATDNPFNWKNGNESQAAAAAAGHQHDHQIGEKQSYGASFCECNSAMKTVSDSLLSSIDENTPLSTKRYRPYSCIDTTMQCHAIHPLVEVPAQPASTLPNTPSSQPQPPVLNAFPHQLSQELLDSEPSQCKAKRRLASQ